MKRYKTPKKRLSGPEKIKTEEKIKFDFDSDVENEMVTVTPRRKSFVDLSPGETTPKLSLPSPSPTLLLRRKSSGLLQ